MEGLHSDGCRCINCGLGEFTSASLGKSAGRCLDWPDGQEVGFPPHAILGLLDDSDSRKMPQNFAGLVG